MRTAANVVILTMCISAHALIVSNLPEEQTQARIHEIEQFYDAMLNVHENTNSIEKFFTEDYILHSNSQTQDLSQVLAHFKELHKTYQKIVRSPFEIIQITNDFVTLKYTVYLTRGNKTKGFNFIAIHHFDHDKLDRTWEVASPTSAQNIH